MRKLATTFGFSTKKSTKDLNSGSKVTCEYWSQGETDATSIDLFGQEGDPVPTTLLVKVTPPQSTDREVGAALGAYCLLIDVSYSMSHEAEITTDGGEKMGFGWSLLDIAKHATSTFISTLSDNDLITIVTYSSAVKTVQEWIKTDATGKTAALAVVKNMRPEVETNLGAGLKAAYEQMTKVPVKPNAIHKYNLQMVVLTDGRPTPEYHPGEGVAWRSYGDHAMSRDVDCSPAIRGAYAMLIQEGQAGAAAKLKAGPLARTMVTSIGLGNELDSSLLAFMSDSFLHIPDPGSVGAFMVNLIAQVRSTARLPDPMLGASAADCVIVISPASALEPGGGGVPGYTAPSAIYGPPASQCYLVNDTLTVPLGTVALDQPRHIILQLKPGAPPVTVSLALHGRTLCEASNEELKRAPAREIVLQQTRLSAIEALDAAAGGAGEGPLTSFLEQLEASPFKEDPFLQALHATIKEEAILGCSDDNYSKWGRHYLRCLPMMLRAERKSNFRDGCLEAFGKDAQGREALFESLSNEAELCFATLKAPTPSVRKGPAAAAALSTNAPAGGALPPEFLRAGGCFAPECTLELLAPVDGDAARVVVAHTRLDAVRQGDLVRTARGGAARVRCVVRIACPGGRAALVQLPGGGPELTEWHPVLDARDGRWRFPTHLGVAAVRACAHVYNLVLEDTDDHVPLVNGVGCVSLAHGLTGPVVGHAYYGSAAVLRDLSEQPGWRQGNVTLAAPLLAPPPAAREAAAAVVRARVVGAAA